MRHFRRRFGGVVYGGDYNPEQWPVETRKEDMRLMQEAGVTLVSLGVFAWGSIEPREGEFEFAWLDESMDMLHEAGIAVNLATPTASPPAWLAHQHPETLPVLADGSTYGFGNRMHYDPASPVFREHAVRITRVIAERYKDHPALAMWHVGNEYGVQSYSDAASERFRDWLRRRYGTLDALNDAWTTRFWGQVYSDWEQVAAPAQPRNWTNPSRKLDYARFTSDLLLECFTAERDVLREVTPDVPIATNFMRFYGRADYWRWAQEEDVVALDLYPNPADVQSHIEAAFMFDLMRSLKGQPWLLMEQATSAVSQWPLNTAKRPGRMRLGSYQAIAHGADSVMFFQWRASRGGSERFHSAMLPHSGTASRTWREVTELGHELGGLGELVGARSTARVAVMFDWDAWWGLTLGNLPVSDLVYPDVVMRHYAPLWRNRIPVDVVSAKSDLTPYDVVIVPNAYLLDDPQKLREFAAAGGHLLLSNFSGVVDGHNRVWENGYPGALRELIGAHVTEYLPAGDESVEIRWADGRITAGNHWREDIVLEGAEGLAVFGGGDVDGQPAVLRNSFGSGVVTYVATRLDAETHEALELEVVATRGVRPLDGPDGLEVTRRERDGIGYVFALNHSDSAVEWSAAPAGRDVLSGAEVEGGLRLEPAGVAIVRENRLSS